MYAHLANEARHDMRRGRAPPAALLHVIVDDACLLGSGVRPALLMGDRGFGALVQTRRHASGACSPWESAFAAYVPAGAAASVLAPEIPGHPDLLPRVPDGGGLFVSLPIEHDGDGLYDPYEAVALRLAWGPDEEHARTLLFAHDELVPRATRYAADAARLTRVCRHFCRYVGSLGRAAPAAAVAAAEHLAAGLPPPPVPPAAPEPPLSAEEQLASGGADEAEDAGASLSQENEEILALVQRAVRDVASRLPVRPRPTPAAPRARQVASGLRQGALGCVGLGGRAAGSAAGAADQDAVLAGLEPPGGGRFSSVGGEDARCVALEDVLTLAPGQDKPRSLVDWLDLGWTALAGGDSVAWLWARRPVSVVPRRHYGGRGRLVVVSYDNSTAWGGRRARGPGLSPRLADALTEACARERVEHPHRLSPRVLADLAERFPRLGAPLRAARPVLPPFDVAAEVAFAHRVRAACVRALGHAVRAALQGRPRLSQRLRYEFGAHQADWVSEVSRRFPVLLDHALRAVDATPVDEFFRTAYAHAVVSHLAGGRGGGAPRLLPLAPAAPALWAPPADGGPGSVYVFDYYATGGETQRVSRRPIAVAIDGDLERDQGRARLLAPPGPPTPEARVCERYLPGESYAYLCVGLDHRLRALFVLPGGFAFTANVAAYLTFPAGTPEAILGRFCREAPPAGGRADARLS
ncbi:DNA packaging tegument protein UL17 [Ateline alphaherpesvirus 1]|uniref:DNA packaging tegument protein UL17 n=1 Tax=Herpesvirus ateles type 1 (strain Lennette) TaxID=35243 RepID=A0A1S6JLP2_HSVA1|nr:DNA packaging tegument protein UL17 [Ateline alphaherpesvirus 1]AQS79199.1 DNA packaging tegument protein UL17 [Ateline alphaherpesvirus 1]